MHDYLLDDVADDVLSRELPEYAAKEDRATVAVLARIAAYDARKLYVAAGYSSMYAYCLEAMHYSEDEACRRIGAARAARRFPALFAALEDRRLHQTAVRLLSPHMTADNAEELIAAASHRSTSHIEQWLAQRFPAHEMLLDTSTSAPVLSAPRRIGTVRVLPDTPAAPPARMTPISAETYDLHATIPKSAHENLRYAQDLLGHAVPSGDVGQVLDRALKLLVAHLERKKFGAAARPRSSPRPSGRQRCIPASIRRAVLQRDGGQCTFVGTMGHRCSSRRRIEFDHIVPVARGGRATVENMRLRCRTHNQYEAEQAFGTEVMNEKRKREEMRRDVLAGLKRLGVRNDVARQALAYAEKQPGATLEERMRSALQYLWPSRVRRPVAMEATA